MNKPVRLSLILALLCLLLVGCAGKEPPYPLSAERIRADTEHLSLDIGVRVTGTEKERETCDWLEASLREMGFSGEDGSLERVPFDGLDDLKSENLIARCNAGHEGPILCVMAHYDTVPGCPGARDNGASTAILLELARALGPRCPELDAEVRLLFLGSEENGYHGSKAYVASLSEEERSRHLAAFNMDISVINTDEDAQLICNTMGAVVDGVYRAGDYTEPLDNLVSRTVRSVHSELYGTDRGSVPVFHYGESDHLSFHQAGIEAANVCWRAVSGPLTSMPKEYHQPNDTPEKLDFQTAVETGRCVLGSLFALAGVES